MSDDRTGAAGPIEHPVGRNPSPESGVTRSSEARTTTDDFADPPTADPAAAPHREDEAQERRQPVDERGDVPSSYRQDSPTARPTAARQAPRTDARPGLRPDGRSGRPEPRAAKTGRRAQLAVKRVDLASVFMTSLALSALLGIVLVVAILVLYGVLESIGAIGSVNDALGEINIGTLPEGGSVLTYAVVIAAVDVVLLTVISTLFAGLYNLVSSFTGGIEVTLVDD